MKSAVSKAGHEAHVCLSQNHFPNPKWKAIQAASKLPHWHPGRGSDDGKAPFLASFLVSLFQGVVWAFRLEAAPKSKGSRPLAEPRLEHSEESSVQGPKGGCESHPLSEGAELVTFFASKAAQF